MARRVSYIDSLRAEVERVILVDAGSFTGSQSGTWEERSLFLLEMMKDLHYDGITLSEDDLKLGREFVRSITAFSDAPFVSANLWDIEANELAFPPFRIVEKGGTRVGITAVTVPGEVLVERLTERGYRVDDPRKVLPALLGKLRREADLIVLLARMPSAEARALGESFRGQIDVVVVGSGEPGRGLAHPENGGAVYILAGNRGQSFGVTRVALGADGIDRITGDEVVLSRSFPEDEEIAGIVNDFQQNLNLIMQQQVVKKIQERASPDGHFFLSAQSCRDCHEQEYEIWQDTPHAHAFQTLVNAGAESFPECYGCHVTGHEDPAGYHPAVENAHELVNVQCEVCHDKGSLHTRDGTYGASLLMNACSQCHDAENSPDFDPDIYWRMIEH